MPFSVHLLRGAFPSAGDTDNAPESRAHPLMCRTAVRVRRRCRRSVSPYAGIVFIVYTGHRGRAKKCRRLVCVPYGYCM